MHSPSQADYSMPRGMQYQFPLESFAQYPQEWYEEDAAQAVIQEQCYLLEGLHTRLVDVESQAQFLNCELQECIEDAQAERTERIRLEEYVEFLTKAKMGVGEEGLMSEQDSVEEPICYTPSTTKTGSVIGVREQKAAGIFTFGEHPAPKVQELRERLEVTTARAAYSPYRDYLGTKPSQRAMQAKTCQSSQAAEEEEEDMKGFEKQMEDLIITDPFQFPFGLLNRIYALKRQKLGLEAIGLCHQSWVKTGKKTIEWPQRRHKRCMCRRHSGC